MEKQTSPQKSFLYRNGLTLVFVVLFIAAWWGQAMFGWNEHNDDLKEHGASPISFLVYLGSGHFWQATFENWESEFLQMALFVILTVFLRQRGSSESKALDDGNRTNDDLVPKPDSPTPVKKGGWRLTVYKNSLFIVLFLLFVFSYVGHFLGSWKDYNQQQQLNHHETAMDMWAFAISPKFWFESFQNWQSEFLSVAAIVFLSIYLRQHGSSQSKPVNASHGETG